MTALVRQMTEDLRVVAAELRPPRRTLGTSAGMDAWIDTYHAVRGITRHDRFVFLTDSAVGSEEEDNLRHLVANLGSDVPRDHIVPFLTTKHAREYCLSYADRAVEQGFSTLVVLGGDRRVGHPRCVEHAWQLRQLVRERQPSLALGGWANPTADPERQAAYLTDAHFSAEFFLTQIVSHHSAGPVERFLREAERQGVRMPGMFGVFYYRSANAKTLATLADFIPVPADALTQEFASGASAEEICARTIRALADLGVRHFYVSNLPVSRAQATLRDILALVHAPSPASA
ncbi:MAG: hypothetical protein U0Q12_04895 [Vicinamibacterales bacterium]